MADEPLLTDEDDTQHIGAEVLTAHLDASDLRLDKALSAALPAISRARLQSLLAAGAVTRDSHAITAGSSRVQPGLYSVAIPASPSVMPQAEALPLTVLFEDDDMIVINKAAGMAVHPAPGCESGTLVNALLHHCASLSSMGDPARPGIVHRLDKDTSGVIVAAKSNRAHTGLSALFAAHDIERTYIALTRGVPTPEKARIETLIGRSSHDRKKMAVLKDGGRLAVTDYVVQRTFGRPAKSSGAPLAARVACTLQTGRTHQIRVHMASKGAPLLGDPVYGSGAPAAAVRAAIEVVGLRRQALHGAILGFVHPVTGETLRFDTEPPHDMQQLEALLSEL